MLNTEENQFCQICGVVLKETYYKCLKCGKVTCPSCQNSKERCCIDCTPLESPRPEKNRTPNPAFMRPMDLSPQLEAVVGKGPLKRTEVTTKLWEYIKARGLQEPSNKRLINADDKLTAVFGGKTQVDMFEMIKLVSKHFIR